MTIERTPEEVVGVGESNGRRVGQKKRRAPAADARHGSSESDTAEDEPLAQRSPVAVGVVVATSLYCGVKAGIQVGSYV